MGMRSWASRALVLFAAAAAAAASTTACASSTRGAPPGPIAPGPSRSAPAPNAPPPEATTANAGRDRCELRGPVDVGVLSASARFAIGFGERGGLVAWSSPSGARARALSSRGELRAEERGLTAPNLAEPREITPIQGGFAVVSALPKYMTTTCEGRCIDATCSGWPAGTPQPVVCSGPCFKPCTRLSGYDMVFEPTDIKGRPLGESTTMAIGPVDISALFPGDSRSFGLLIATDIVRAQLALNGSLAVSRSPLPSAYFALPVRGEGPPTLLLIDEDGKVRVADASGVRPVQGSLLSEESGHLIDARMQARRGADGQIHLARQAWLVSLTSIRYAVIHNLELHFEGPPASGGLREPFAEYVDVHKESGVFRRTSWLQRAVGEDIDLRSLDQTADVSTARAAWTGSSFAFAYSTRAREGARALRLITAHCA